MDFDRNSMTVPMHSSDYTNNFLQKDSNPTTMEVVTQTNSVKSPTDSPETMKLVYTVEEIARMLAISLRSAYNLCNHTTEFRMDWLPKQCSKHKWALKTYESNLSTIQNLIIPYIGSMEMQKLKPYHMENLYTILSKTPCGSYIEGRKQELTEKQKQRFLSGTTSLILKSTKTASSCRTIFMTSALKEELKKWLNQLAADERKDPTRYHDSGMLFRLPNGLAVEPVLIRKKFLKWQDAHPEFPRIVFHGLRHSSATYQLMISGGDVKAVQGTTGHATADMLVNTYAHIQQSSRVELGRKFEEGFYAKHESPSPQAVPAEGEPTISITALLELLKNAAPEVKAQLRLALLT